jgi:CPA2 family monovalent cation:H+ antiporter-2
VPHEQGLIVLLAAAFVLAFALGYVAIRLKLPPVVGYLLAGVLLGPFTPGMQADVPLAGQLAEVGVILLMFGVGIHFSPKDLVAARGVIVPGAVLQMAIATIVGATLARFWGWSWSSGIVFGLSLSIASTAVVLKALEGQGILDTSDGRLTIGWLVVEDIAMVIALVLLPALAPPGAAGATEVVTRSIWVSLGITLLKVGAFIAVMLYFGRKLVPAMLDKVARTGSRELFTLGVLAIALGIALGAAQLFTVSFALGAFFAGIVIGESDLSHQAAADALPLQDAFAVLFFVSVGMLVDPTVLLEQPLRVVGVLGVILVGQSLAASVIAVMLGKPLRTALVLGASVGQIGEFSFILAALGVSLGLLTTEAQSLILAGAVISITINPLLFSSVDPTVRWLSKNPRLIDTLERWAGSRDHTAMWPTSALHSGHVIIIGYGRVGGTIGEVLKGEGIPFVVIERDRNTVEAAREAGVSAIYGDAARPGLLEMASVASAKLLVCSTPDPLHGKLVIELARKLNPHIETVVRTHSHEELETFRQMHVGRAFLGERELAFGMAKHTLRVVRREPQSWEAPGRKSTETKPEA